MPGMPVGPAGKREELVAIKGKTAPLTATPAPGTTGIQGDSHRRDLLQRLLLRLRSTGP
jgi:hypothetical protein